MYLDRSKIKIAVALNVTELINNRKTMDDIYTKLAKHPISAKLFTMLNLPIPIELDRSCQSIFESNNVLLSAAKTSKVISHYLKSVENYNNQYFYPNPTDNVIDLNALFNTLSLKAFPISLNSPDKQVQYNQVIFDASEIKDASELVSVYSFFSPIIKKLAKNAKIVIIGDDPQFLSNVEQITAQTALLGFCKSLAKEVGKNGITCQLLQSAPHAEKQLIAPITFFTSPSSAYITGQNLRVQPGTSIPVTSIASANSDSLIGKIAVVTGASRGIGKSIALTLADKGAYVVCLDIESQFAQLQAVADQISGKAISLDITSSQANQTFEEIAKDTGIDIIVHNAGVTMDKTLARMQPLQWNLLMDINLCAIQRINKQLLQNNLINQAGRIICISSISGIAGNVGQTNYATSKAGVIGYVNALSDELLGTSITINAVAPGFIETQMTAKMPVLARQIGRRANSLKQGGLPIDVAEAICFFASPSADGISGNTLRVCGQNILGA